MTVVPFKKRTPILGIDLGTTNSLVAVFEGGRPRVLPNALGELLTPSAVSLGDDGEFLVGSAALARASTHPDRTATAFKRAIGTSRREPLGDHALTPVELSALVLSCLRRDAETALGVEVRDAVVTVPAYFGESQRQATRDAAELAGLRVLRLINEPTAAALAHGLASRGRDLSAVVLDLGGGTFDVTILRITEGVVEVSATGGDARLGGNDFTEALADLVAARVERSRRLDLGREASVRARLLAAAERAKRTLSEATFAEITLATLPSSLGANAVEERITREDAERCFEPLLARLRRPILRALSDAGVDPRSLDDVLLVGGATRMPCVRRVAEELFGREPLTSLPPDESVALGAAVQGALIGREAAVDDLVVTDIAPFTLGVAVVQDFRGSGVSGVFSPIIERGTVIPTSRVERFSARSPTQRQIRVEVFQGEHSMCEDNTRLGDLLLDDVPAATGGTAGVDVRFSYDVNGLLEVEATLVETGQRETLVLDQAPGRLTPDEIEASRRRLASLKIHPREKLPNATALARAEALHVELVGSPRRELAEMLTAFRAALDTKDPGSIERHRRGLLAVVERLRLS